MLYHHGKVLPFLLRRRRRSVSQNVLNTAVASGKITSYAGKRIPVT
jgi:hypothetical protein